MGNTECTICSSEERGARQRAPSCHTAREAYASYEGNGPWFTCRPNGMMTPRLAEIGPASQGQIPATTLPKLINMVKIANGSNKAFMIERPCPDLVDGTPPPPLPISEWTSWTFAQYHEEITAAAAGMIKMGFSMYDSVNIWGFNAPEWTMGALAASVAGGKVAGLYPTDTADAAAYKVVHSGGSIVVVDDKSKITKLVQGLEARGDLKRLKAFVAWGYEPTANEQVKIKGFGSVPVISWKTLITLGDDASKNEMDARQNSILPGNCAALIYTSGTTGDPKAVMISHDNIVYEAAVIKSLLEKSVGFGKPGEQERIVSYLPLSHVAGMMVDIVMPMINSTGTSHTTTYFARNYDLKAGSFKDRLCAARPTLFLGVPLVWEKIADKMRAVGAANTGLKKALGDWAKGKAVCKARGQQLGGTNEVPFGISIAETLLGKAREALGLDHLKFGLTGAAPIRVDTLEYFGSLGIQINEVYGMSECAGACTVSLKEAHQWGSCGWEVPGVEVRVFKVNEQDFNVKVECPRSPALDETDEKYMGEICWRGRNNMMGYMAQPDLGRAHVAEIEKKTAETIDNDGWLHSGDKGMLTEAGMVKITGRYKELIIGDGGENIAPVPIEDSIKKLVDGVNEVMMIGDKRKYNVALITLKAVGANGESPGTDDLDAGAKRLNPAVSTISAAMDDALWLKTITDAIAATNQNAKVCINAAFAIQKFMILPSNFSEEGNELTPTKKLKRALVAAKYSKQIEQMYASKGTYVRYAQ